MWLWMVAALAAYFVKGLCGFASTIVFGTVLGFSVTNAEISPVDCLFTIFSNSIMSWRGRKYLKSEIILPCAVIMVVFSIVGTLFLKNTDAHIIKLIFGLVVIFVGVNLLIRDIRGTRKKTSKIVELISLITAGVMTGLYGISVLTSVYLSQRIDDANEFKANLSCIFLFEGLVRVISYTLLGIITVASLKTAALILPCMLIGLFAGMKCANVLDPVLAKRVVLVMLMISGLALVLATL